MRLRWDENERHCEEKENDKLNSFSSFSWRKDIAKTERNVSDNCKGEERDTAAVK